MQEFGDQTNLSAPLQISVCSHGAVFMSERFEGEGGHSFRKLGWCSPRDSPGIKIACFALNPASHKPAISGLNTHFSL